MKNVIPVLLLALAGWVAFYMMGAPLNSNETLVLVAIAGILVWGIRRLYRALHRTKSDEET
jgi:hypothetical protein